MNPNFHPKNVWVKIRTRGSQASICVRIFTQFTNSPAKVLEIAQNCARVNGNVDIWYNAGVNKSTLIGRIEPHLLAQETDKAIDALTKALQDVRAKKGS